MWFPKFQLKICGINWIIVHFRGELLCLSSHVSIETSIRITFLLPDSSLIFPENTKRDFPVYDFGRKKLQYLMVDFMLCQPLKLSDYPMEGVLALCSSVNG